MGAQVLRNLPIPSPLYLLLWAQNSDGRSFCLLPELTGEAQWLLLNGSDLSRMEACAVTHRRTSSPASQAVELDRVE